MEMEKGYIKITPFDGLFFGKGRPFHRGDDTWTEADLLPAPPVIWGALFSQLWCVENNIQLDSLKIGKIMLMGENSTQLYLPAPLDVFSEINSNGKRFHHQFYWQEEEDYFHWNEGKNVLLKPETKEEEVLPEGELLSVSSLKNYAGADLTFDVKIKSTIDLIKSEFKIGIARSEELKSIEEGMLYTVNLSQLNDNYSLIVEVEYPKNKFPISGVLKLGGEGKLAHFETFGGESELTKSIRQALYLPDEPGTLGFFKVYLTSPAPLNENGIPVFLKDKQFSIEAGVVGRPVSYGGFDLKLQRPKPMEMVVPAGSIYIIEYIGEEKRCTTSKAKQLLGYQTYGNGFNQFEIFPYYGDKRKK